MALHGNRAPAGPFGGGETAVVNGWWTSRGGGRDGRRAPTARRPPGLPPRRVRGPRRRMRLLALGMAAVAVLVVLFAMAAARDIPPRHPPARGPAGAIDRNALLLVPPGRSRAEVRAVLGPPRVTRRVPGDPEGTECWRYGARSGRPVTYEVCFDRGFVSGKSIVRVRTPLFESDGSGTGG
jgi:hypothetical protein